MISAVYVADAPGEGPRISKLPEKPATRTVYLLPSNHPKPTRLFPFLLYDPEKSKERPDRYYAPETLSLCQLLLAWRSYKLRRLKHKRWRITLLQKAPSVYYFAFDKHRRIIDYNPALAIALKTLGLPKPKLGRPVLDIVLPENKQAFLEEIEMVLEGQAIQLQRVIGSRYGEIHMLPLSQKRQVFAYYALDTTVYRRLLESSVAQQMLQEAILGNLRDGILLLDSDHHILYANSAAERILREDAKKLLGSLCPLWNREGVCFYKDTPLSITNIPLRDERLLLILRDLSELWEAEKGQALFRKVIDEAPLAIFLLAIKGANAVTIYHNHTLRKYFPHEDLEYPLDILKTYARRKSDINYQRLKDSDEPFQTTLYGSLKKNGWTHLLAIFFPIRLLLPSGETETYWAAVLQDQTAVYQATEGQRRMERQQHQLILEAQEKERQYLAEELHDNLGMLLSVLKMELSTILHDTPTSSPLKSKLQALSVRLDEVIQNVRLTSHQLMPPLVEHFGLVPSLEGLIRRIKATSKLQIHLEVNGTETALPFLKVLQVYRIIQELINNAIRHAQAQNLYIQFTYKKNRLHIEVKDDGKGYDPTAVQREGIGLRNIVGRLQVLGATWENLSAIGKGAYYRIEVPLPRQKS
ncbi:MAG: histidine kinase [Bacteroidia bacterium]|nr:histidine kinase [Bacteroidia bacterium]